jgi:prepilin peptidase CpaA
MSAAIVILVLGAVFAAIVDLRFGRIPNLLTAAMALAAIALHLTDGTTALLVALASMGVAFAVGAVSFSAGWFGGGDVKLIAAACGLVSYPGCLSLVAFVLVAGAVLALAQALRARRLVALVRNATLLATRGSMPESPALLPYGVAIAGGSVAYACSIILIPLMFPQ